MICPQCGSFTSLNFGHQENHRLCKISLHHLNAASLQHQRECHTLLICCIRVTGPFMLDLNAHRSIFIAFSLTYDKIKYLTHGNMKKYNYTCD